MDATNPHPVIEDHAAGMPMRGAAPVVVALSLLGRPAGTPPPMATCPHDGEPLIATLEQDGAEFLCMVCGRFFGFLAPTPAVETPELTARYDDLRARHAAGARPWHLGADHG